MVGAARAKLREWKHVWTGGTVVAGAVADNEMPERWTDTM